MKSTRFWITLTAAVFIASLAASLFLFRGKGGSTAEIYSNGELVHSIELSLVTEPYSFTVKSENGGENTVSVERGRICVSQADCPDGVCLRQGWIQNGVAPIVCLPNGLVISITGGDNGGVDAVS